MANIHKAQAKAKDILEKYGKKSQNKIDVHGIARKLGIKVSITDFSNDISGVLDLSGSEAKILSTPAMMNTGKGFPSRMRLVIFYCIKKMEFM